MKEDFKGFSTELLQSLTRYWQQFVYTLPRIVMGVLVLVLVLFLAARISAMLQSRLTGKAHDPLFARFVARLAKFAIIVVGFIFCLQVLGLSGVAGGLLAGAGISAFIIGFAFKDIAENFLAGIILAFNRPFALNDTIKLNEYVGHVKELNFRTTHIKTFDEKDVFIPNAMVIKEPLVNMTRDGMLRIDFMVGIAYEDDIKSAVALIQQTIHNNKEVRSDKPPFVVVEELATSTVNLRMFFWVDTDDYKKGVLLTKSDVMQSVKEVLTEKGFTLPADIQELKLYDKRDALPVSLVNTKNTQG